MQAKTDTIVSNMQLIYNNNGNDSKRVVISGRYFHSHCCYGPLTLADSDCIMIGIGEDAKRQIKVYSSLSCPLGLGVERPERVFPRRRGPQYRGCGLVSAQNTKELRRNYGWGSKCPFHIDFGQVVAILRVPFVAFCNDVMVVFIWAAQSQSRKAQNGKWKGPPRHRHCR